MNDPMLDPDTAVRQAYIDKVNKTVAEFVEQDAAQRKFWASQRSVGGTTIIGETGFGEGNYAVDTPQ